MCDYCDNEWCNGECQRKQDYGDCTCGRRNCSGCYRPSIIRKDSKDNQIKELEKRVKELEKKIKEGHYI